jgi:hypothetical protein
VVDPRRFGLGTAQAGYEVVAGGTGRVKVVVDVR